MHSFTIQFENWVQLDRPTWRQAQQELLVTAIYFKKNVIFVNTILSYTLAA